MQESSINEMAERNEGAQPAQQFNLRHYWYVMLERRWLVIVTFVLVLAGCITYLVLAPRLYAGVVRLQIDRESEGAVSLRDMGSGAGVMDQDYLQTQYKILQSKVILDAVIQKEKLRDDPRYAKEYDIPQALADDLTIAPIRLSRLVDVRVRHTSAKKAASIANTLADEYMERNRLLREGRTSKNVDYLRNEVDKLAIELEKEQKKLQETTRNSKFVSLDLRQSGQGASITAEALSRSQAAYADARGRSHAAATIISELEKHVGLSPFSEDDLKPDPGTRVPAFIGKVSQSNALSTYIRGSLSPATQQQINSFLSAAKPAVEKQAALTNLQDLLVQDLNSIRTGPSIFEAEPFAQVNLRPETRKLLSTSPRGLELRRLNRLLLEDAFPAELTRRERVEDAAPIETFPQIASDPQIKQLELQLASLENELAGLRQKYKDKMPQVQQTILRIGDSKRAIQHSAENLAEGLIIDAKVARSQEASLKEVVGEWEAQQAEWNKAKADYDGQAQAVDIKTRLYQAALSRYEETKLLQYDQAKNITIVDRAVAPLKPDSPNVPIVAILGVILALGSSIGFALFVNYLDDSVKTQDDVETYLQVPFLGYIPTMRSNSVWERYVFAHLEPQSSAAESYRTLRAAISLGSQGARLRMITVTSTSPGEGKSVAAANLAIVMAQTGLKTLLIDADLRRPWVHKAFQIETNLDLTSYLLGKTSDISSLIKKTEVNGLDVVCASGGQEQPSELLSSRRMPEFLEEVRRLYDRVIIDCPPVSAVSDPLVLSSVSDGVLYVVKFNKVLREHARNSIERIQNTGAYVIGAVLNDIDFEGRDAYYYSFYNYQNRYYSGYYTNEEEEGPEPKEKAAASEGKA